MLYIQLRMGHMGARCVCLHMSPFPGYVTCIKLCLQVFSLGPTTQFQSEPEQQSTDYPTVMHSPKH